MIFESTPMCQPIRFKEEKMKAIPDTAIFVADAFDVWFIRLMNGLPIGKA